MSVAKAMDDLSTVTENTEKDSGTVPHEADTRRNFLLSSDADIQDDTETVYTLYLTHILRFKVNGKGKSVSIEEKLELGEADFKDGVCNLNQFAYDVEQLMVTEANPLSRKAFDEDHEGGARIVYDINSGWKIAPAKKAGNKGTALRTIFNGALSDYEFIPADIIRIKANYVYSKTGGLAGRTAASPGILETLVERKEDGSCELEWVLPTVDGFRIVMDPHPLDTYLVKPPTGQETAEELQAALERGDYNVDIKNHTVYYYQEQSDGQMNPDYNNRYSTEYNEAWNSARTIRVEGDSGYTAMAVCGQVHSGRVEKHGANALVNPTLKVTLTSEQTENAIKNGLEIMVNYRRNATWYMVNHWVPKELSGLTEDQIKDRKTKTEEGIEYVLLDTEELQGRVGALTNASAKTEGIYEMLTPLGFSQKLIVNATSVAADAAVDGTEVDIHYTAAEFYRVIFDTNYTYIPRQQVALNGTVDFTDVSEPRRTGYTFDGWQYLKKNARPDANGKYSDDSYIKVTDINGNYALQITPGLISKEAKLHENRGVLALHLYPVWKPDTTQVRVILWTEDLTGTDDVYAKAAGGNTSYYDSKYKAYENEPKTHSHTPEGGNANYSNVGSFTMKLDTDSSLVKADNNLLDTIQAKITETFKSSVGTVGDDASRFYT